MSRIAARRPATGRPTASAFVWLASCGLLALAPAAATAQDAGPRVLRPSQHPGVSEPVNTRTAAIPLASKGYGEVAGRARGLWFAIWEIGVSI